MNPSIVNPLATIGEKPTVSLRDTLAITRSVLRYACQTRANLLAERHAMRRQANKLRQLALAVAGL
jgi:hypothetical protein